MAKINAYRNEKHYGYHYEYSSYYDSYSHYSGRLVRNSSYSSDDRDIDEYILSNLDKFFLDEEKLLKKAQYSSIYTGSGVTISDNGYIATNQHVVQIKAKDIKSAFIKKQKSEIDEALEQWYKIFQDYCDNSVVLATGEKFTKEYFINTLKEIFYEMFDAYDIDIDIQNKIFL